MAFGLRLTWLLYAKAAPPYTWQVPGDQYSYWYYGNEIAAGRGYVHYITHTPTAYYPIGYPGLLAALFFVAIHTHVPGDLMFWAGFMHVVFGAATVALVFFIGRRLFNPTVGLIAAALLAVFPNAIYEVTTLQLETAFIFFSTAALAIIVVHDWSHGLPSRNRLLAFGFVLGLSVLVRPFSVWFLVGLFLAALAANAGWRRAFTVTLVPALVVVGMSIPWVIRNEIRMHAFILTSTNTGDTLCLDRNLTAHGGFRFADHDGCVDPNLPEVPRNAGNTRKAISFVIHHPARKRWRSCVAAGSSSRTTTTGSRPPRPSEADRSCEQACATCCPTRPTGTSSSCSVSAFSGCRCCWVRRDAGPSPPRPRRAGGDARHPSAAVGQSAVPPSAVPVPRAAGRRRRFTLRRAGSSAPEPG